MFHNPFNKTSKQSIKKLPKIIIDIHEKNSLVLSELYSSNQIELITRSLKIGDYLINNIIIERKTNSDFISSMINKRLKIQINQMQIYSKKLLIIEDDNKPNYSNVNPAAIRGFILSILTNYNLPIIFTKSYKDTAEYLITLAKQQHNKKSVTSTLHSRIPKSIKEQKQYILESFPNLGPQTTIKLLEKFKSLKNIFNAKDKDLEPILKKKTRDFINILNST